jgi:hypothetical protein
MKRHIGEKMVDLRGTVDREERAQRMEDIMKKSKYCAGLLNKLNKNNL